MRLPLAFTTAAAAAAPAAGIVASNDNVSLAAAADRDSKATESDHSGYEPLSPWDKIAIMSVAAGVVALTVVAVLCAVMPGCLLHRWCCGDEVDGKDRRLHSEF